MSQFEIHVREMAYGWTNIKLLINGQIIISDASYTGSEPLCSLIDACLSFYMTDYKDENEEDEEEYLTWEKEPGSLDLDLRLDKKRQIHFDIKEYDDDKTVLQEWHEIVPFELFRDAVVAEGFRVLNAFGIYGYSASWMGQAVFPLGKLLRLTGKLELEWNEDFCWTDLSKEVECLSSHIEKLEIKEEKHYNECTIYYESWQIQCCGDPFEVGEKIDWTCIMPTDFKNAHGIVLDFQEEHHGFATHTICGTVDKIVAERSEFPKGKRIVRYEAAQTIQEEISKANGWEKNYKDDETTERTFWGYIVTLKDAVVKPLTGVTEEEKT